MDFTVLTAGAVFSAVAMAPLFAHSVSNDRSALTKKRYLPEYTASGDLTLPMNFKERVFVNSPLAPNALNGGNANFPELYNIYLEPGSYEISKVVLDACNAVPARDGAIAETAREKGIGLLSAELLPGTRVVRAFNTLSYRILARDAHRSGPPLAIPIAGDDAEALRVASGLVRDAGFEPVVVGPLSRASDFAQGARGYGQEVDASELRRRLGLEQ